MDASDREMSTAVLIRSLREMPDPPVDMVAAERSLHQGLRHRAVRRRVASVIVVLALVALVITGLNLWRSPEGAPLPARQLQSGLPIGTLLGNVTYHEPDGPHPAQLVLVVRRDGTGTYSMRVVMDDERINDNSSWPVRFVGTSPGRVVIKRAADVSHGRQRSSHLSSRDSQRGEDPQREKRNLQRVAADKPRRPARCRPAPPAPPLLIYRAGRRPGAALGDRRDSSSYVGDTKAGCGRRLRRWSPAPARPPRSRRPTRRRPRPRPPRGHPSSSRTAGSRSAQQTLSVCLSSQG